MVNKIISEKILENLLRNGHKLELVYASTKASLWVIQLHFRWFGRRSASIKVAVQRNKGTVSRFNYSILENRLENRKKAETFADGAKTGRWYGKKTNLQWRNRLGFQILLN